MNRISNIKGKAGENPDGDDEKGIINDHVESPYIPTPIITEILSRVRIETIFNCRLVCKSWDDIISTPEFAKLHLSRSPTRCLIKPNSEKDVPERLHLINLESQDSPNNGLVFITNFYLPYDHLHLTNSCNGLFCLYSRLSSNVVVCNPVLGEYITIPKPKNIGRDCEFTFGFSHITGQYKVLLSSYVYGLNYCQVQICRLYRLGEGSWRSIESISYKLGYINFNAFCNGALHWIDYRTRSPFICCFDFVTEEFRAVPEPVEFDQYEERPFSDNMYVGVINENLSVYDFCYVFGNHVIIWVMKNYGVKESWTKDFVITHTNYDKWLNPFEPLMVNGNGEIFLIDSGKLLMLYDPKSGDFGSKYKGLAWCSYSLSGSTAHVPSLISLKDVAKGENLKNIFPSIMNRISIKGKAAQLQARENPDGEDEKGIINDHVESPYLPTPIITEILSRVRIETIFNCRLVCKSWEDIISTPEFAKLHISRSPTRCLIKPSSEKDVPERLHLINLEPPDSPNHNPVFITNFYLPYDHLHLTNSCNGLVCLYSKISKDAVVCNPVLGEYITIPKPTNIDWDCEFAFGFSHITGQYKVLLSSYDHVQIYRLGEGSWRSIESVTYRLGDINFNAFCNGALHWIDYRTRSPFICCFDFVTEEFRAVPEPVEFDQYDERPFSDKMYVGVINENLSVYDFCYIFGNHVIIWVMKNYGVKESWSKDFVLTHINNDRRVSFEPIMVNDNGEIFMIISGTLLVLYDPESGYFGSNYKGLAWYSFSLSGSTAHVPSLISLKDVAKGENLKVLRSINAVLHGRKEF